MILFKEDFHLQGATIDIHTRNQSFVKTSLILKNLGVENNKFMLSIFDRDLIGRDPHNLNDPSLELRMRIATECKINPWYYFREVVRIPVQGADPVQFKMNRANCGLIWVYYNHFDLIQVIPRQTGKTISTQAIYSHIVYIYGKNLAVTMLTKDNKLRQENVLRLKDIRDAIPDYLIYKQVSDNDNKEGISYTYAGTRYLTFVARKDEAGADNLGRGMTTPTQHWDEIAMFPNVHISYPVAINSTNAAVDTAKAAGQPCSNILTTTAGSLDTKEGRFTHERISNALHFSEKIYDAQNRGEVDEILSAGSTNKMFYLVYSYLQLGYTHEWFKEKTSRTGATQDDIDRDYYNIWKFGKSTGVIPQHILKLAKENVKDPLFTDINDGYIVNWYVDRTFIENGDYDETPMILGMDSSENIGRDFTALVLMDARNMRVIATMRCNEVNILRVAMFIARFLVRFKGTLFIPERNSTGTTIVDAVILELEKAGMNPFRRIFNQVIQNKKESPFDKINIDAMSRVDGSVRKYFGFRTTSASKSRDFLYTTVLSKALEMNAHRINDTTIVDELSGLAVRNGRIDHTTSGHDDTVIAYLLACYVLFAGENLEYYGIESNVLLSQIESAMTEAEVTERSLQESLRAECNKIRDQINDTTNTILRSALMTKLRNMESRINTEIAESNPISIELVKAEDGAVKYNRTGISQSKAYEIINCL